MAKIEFLTTAYGKAASFLCPGCGMPHTLTIRSDRRTPSPCWRLTGGVENPTMTPSVLCTTFVGEREKPLVCHFFIRAGQVQFLQDSTHALSGQTVDMPEVEPRIDGVYRSPIPELKPINWDNVSQKLEAWNPLASEPIHEQVDPSADFYPSDRPQLLHGGAGELMATQEQEDSGDRA